MKKTDKKVPLKRHTVLFLLIFLFQDPFISGEEKKRVVLKYATLAPVGSLWYKRWEEMAGKILNNPYLPVTFITYPGGVMGDEPSMVRKLRLGQIHLAGLTINGLAQAVPEVLVLTLPYLFRDSNEVDYVVEKIYPTLKKYAEERGFYLVALYDLGWVRLGSTRKLEKPEDLYGMKMWAWSGDPVGQGIYESLGIVGVSLPLPQVLFAMKNRMIEVVGGTPLSWIALRWDEEIRYISPPFFYAPAGTLLSLDALRKVLPEKKKEELFLSHIDTISQPLTQWINESIREEESSALSALLERGAVLLPWDSSTMERFYSREKIYQKLVGNLFPKEIYDLVTGYLEEYRRKKEIPGEK